VNKKTIRDIDVSGKRVLVRVDYNVPLDDGRVTDDTRVRASVPTLQALLAQRPRVLVLVSHLGRPKGKPNAAYSLAPVAPVLAGLLEREVIFLGDCVGQSIVNAIDKVEGGSVVLLENTRFYAGEEKNDPDFAAQLSQLGDVLVNDAFGTAHRAHASNVGVAETMPAVAGLLMEREIDYLSKAVEDPMRPFVAILGGAKVSDKILVIEKLLQKVDRLLIGGGMANTFLKAKGSETGDSLVESDSLDTARMLMERAGEKMVLPIDYRIANAFDNEAQSDVISADQAVAEGWRILDIGPSTLAKFGEVLETAQTVIWNGPMGVFEMPNFAKGTYGVADLMARLTERGTTTIVGGGDSAAAVEEAGLSAKMTHVSTGGGASLELLEGKTLPGLAALVDRS
jgi:phosphoglycerate kinase